MISFKYDLIVFRFFSTDSVTLNDQKDLDYPKMVLLIFRMQIKINALNGGCLDIYIRDLHKTEKN